MTPTGHRRLILTRHAKSAWDDPSLEDFDRPLNGRGRRSARLLGDFIASRGYEPEEVICSPSKRTRETWELIAPSLPEPAKLRMLPRMYHAGPAQLLAVLHGAGGTSVLMLAHNPGIAMFAEMMARTQPEDPAFARYPTGATTVLEFDAESWAGVAAGTGTPLAFVTPRALE